MWKIVRECYSLTLVHGLSLKTVPNSAKPPQDFNWIMVIREACAIAGSLTRFQWFVSEVSLSTAGKVMFELFAGRMCCWCTTVGGSLVKRTLCLVCPYRWTLPSNATGRTWGAATLRCLCKKQEYYHAVAAEVHDSKSHHDLMNLMPRLHRLLLKLHRRRMTLNTQRY